MGSKTPTAKKPKTGGRDPGESRARQSTADVVVEINKLWEKLRSKSTSSDDASKLSESVFGTHTTVCAACACRHLSNAY